MKNSIRNNAGVTLMILVITIIVLTIIASITIYEGRKSIEEAEAQKSITEMLSVKSKVNGYSEEIDSKTWDKSNDEDTKIALFEEKNLTKTEEIDKNIFASKDVGNNFVFYNVTAVALKNMKLEDLIENEESNYIVVFAKSEDGTYQDCDVIYTKGIKFEKKMYYTLSELQVVMDGE